VFCEAILSGITAVLPSEKSPFTLERFFVVPMDRSRLPSARLLMQ
jgi:hypothetical protein